MRIVQLTPGTGNFYCGSCLRDNALVTALRRQGHDAVLLPLYLPHVVDEASAAEGAPIFFGGINVYLQQQYTFFRRSPAWLDRWFDARWLLNFAASRASMTTAADHGEMALSMLRGEEGLQVKELEKTIAWLQQPANKPDLISLSNGMLVGAARRLRAALSVPVVVSLQGEDGFLDGLPEPWHTAAWALMRAKARDASLLIAVSRTYARSMARRLELPEERIAVSLCGIHLDGFPDPAAEAPKTASEPGETLPAAGLGAESRPGAAAPASIGFLSRLHPSKGLHRLIAAFIEVRRRGRCGAVRLRIAGSQTEGDRAYVDECRARLDAAGLSQDVDLLPNLDRGAKIRFLQTLDLLSVPVEYGEAFGLYLLEAWACGVPVVQPASGAFPELLGQTGAGVLYDPASENGLVEALEELLLDPARRRMLGALGPAAVRDRFTADHMARSFLAACERAQLLHPCST